jgi:hypothetical protein
LGVAAVTAHLLIGTLLFATLYLSKLATQTDS